jgi:sugar/nucleoside kinase (ribokinase family)
VVVGDDIVFSNLSQEDKKKILARINILKVDHAEAKALTDKEDIEDATKDLVKLGPKEVLLTHEKGISVYTNNKLIFFPWKNKYMKGRTGRGDTAFISYVGSRITKNPEESLKFAAALTSLKLEIQGPFILPLNVVEDFIKKEYK